MFVDACHVAVSSHCCDTTGFINLERMRAANYFILAVLNDWKLTSVNSLCEELYHEINRKLGKGGILFGLLLQ